MKKLSIIAILVSISAMSFGQVVEQDLDYDKMKDELTVSIGESDTAYYWFWPECGDTIKDGETITITTHDDDFLTTTPYVRHQAAMEIINLYDQYLEQRGTRQEHDGSVMFVSDCNMVEKEHRYGMSVAYSYECTNKEHFKEVKIPATFEGFIKWLRTQ